MAQQEVERRQGSQPQPGKSGTDAQSDRRRQQQGGEQQAARQTRGLQKRSPTLPIGPLGGLSPFSLMRRMLEDMDRMFEGLGGARGEEGIYRSERRYGRFSRVIPLPEAADVDKAAARFENR